MCRRQGWHKPVDPGAPFSDTISSALNLQNMRIQYARLFEKSAVIGGKPLLWLPLPTVPLRPGRPMTPSQYARSVGPLVSIERTGQPPLLFPESRATRGRRGAAVGLERKPLYVDLSSVAIAKRFDIKSAARKAVAQLPSLYAKYLRTD